MVFFFKKMPSSKDIMRKKTSLREWRTKLPTFQKMDTNDKLFQFGHIKNYEYVCPNSPAAKDVDLDALKLAGKSVRSLLRDGMRTFLNH